MAFAETLRKLGTLVGLYEKDAYSGGDDYNAYDRPDAPYQDDAYSQPAEREPSYQSTYGATGNYARAGARPRQQSAPPQQQRYQEGARGASYGSQGQTRQGGWQGARPDNVIPMPERDGRAERDYAAQEADYPRQDARTAAPPQPMGSARTTVICSRRLEDSEQIINYLIEGVTVVLNLEELDDMLFRRVLDMISGAAYALNANIVRTSLRVYLIAPRNMVVLDEQQPRDREGRSDARDSRAGYSSRW